MLLLRPLLLPPSCRYHFSCQFTADLIAMNHADFIVTSTYQVGGRAQCRRAGARSLPLAGGGRGLRLAAPGRRRRAADHGASCRRTPGPSPPRALLRPHALGTTPHAPPPPQEIAGHEEMVGQYESYKSFTMPQLYRVVEVRGGRGGRRTPG